MKLWRGERCDEKDGESKVQSEIEDKKRDESNEENQNEDQSESEDTIERESTNVNVEKEENVCYIKKKIVKQY